MSNLMITLEELLNDENIDLSIKDMESLLSRMLAEIGNTDSYLRDRCIYEAFVKLIGGNYLTITQETHLLETCLDEQHLFWGLGQEGHSDQVFTRSFSSLVIAYLLYKDSEQCKMDTSLIEKAIEASIQYLLLEKDRRGYVTEKGWAHSVAHGSDLLANAIQHHLFDIHNMNRCLQAIKTCLITEYAYIDEEDERLLTIIVALIQKGLDDQALVSWLEGLEADYAGDDLAKYRMHWNVKKFANTLFIYLQRHEGFHQTKQWILRLYERTFI
ncbi:MAG: DUF2785 domain-containing protein [Lysinibacillus sp.]